MSEDLQYVYTLCDPRDYIPRYVGITNKPDYRLQQHISCDKSNAAKDKWIQGLLSEGVTPFMEVIETVNNRVTVLEREHYWIEYYFDNAFPLLNIAYSPYVTIEALCRAVGQEFVRRKLDPSRLEKYDRWVERALEAGNLGPYYKLLEAVPKSIAVLLDSALRGSPSLVDRAVRELIKNIEYYFFYLQAFLNPKFVNLELWKDKTS